jgi:hypothetical protein
MRRQSLLYRVGSFDDGLEAHAVIHESRASVPVAATRGNRHNTYRDFDRPKNKPRRGPY